MAINFCQCNAAKGNKKAVASVANRRRRRRSSSFAFPFFRRRSSGFWALDSGFCCCSHFWLSHRCRLMRHPHMCEYIESRPKQRRGRSEDLLVQWSHHILATQPPSHPEPPPPNLARAGAPAIVCMHIKFNRMYSLHSMRCGAPSSSFLLFSRTALHSAYT